MCIDEILRTGLIPSSFRVADLGSGAGIPGIFLSIWFCDATFVLIDSMKKRAKFLEETVASFGLENRVAVFEGRSEECAGQVGYRQSFDLVTARGFAMPAATAENASGLLHRMGILLVSEPPEPDASRWPRKGLGILGFDPPISQRFEVSFCWMVKSHAARGKFPRGIGIPEKAPLF